MNDKTLRHTASRLTYWDRQDMRESVDLEILEGTSNEEFLFLAALRAIGCTRLDLRDSEIAEIEALVAERLDLDEGV